MISEWKQEMYSVISESVIGGKTYAYDDLDKCIFQI